MKTRQMAFQVTEFEYREALKTLISVRGQVASVTSWVDQIQEEKKKLRMKAILQIAIECHRKGLDPLRVKKIVCWRDDKGLPGHVDIEFHRLRA